MIEIFIATFYAGVFDGGINTPWILVYFAINKELMVKAYEGVRNAAAKCAADLPHPQSTN